MLAAGRGTRLGKLTANRPKPMVPVQNRPVIEHILLGLRSVGITECLLVVSYRAEVIREFVADGSAFDIHVEYVDQLVPDGTGSALRLGRSFADDDAVLATYGDILTYYSNYHDLLNAYRCSNTSAVIGINPVDDPSAGAAVYRDGSQLIRVVEKPPRGTSNSHWNVAGINVFGPQVWDILDSLKPSPRGEYELTDAITALIETAPPVGVSEIAGFWSDVGTPEALAKADRVWHP